ncbi:MAG: penicillin-binding protein 2 [Candidatus Saelkia tenebricola]|nr:penicillin-binding protein 2 [Candidatus Saelkia tenebricola]
MFSKVYKVFLTASISLLMLRLVNLQLIHGSFFYNMSVNNYLRVLPLSGFRGNILDRYGQELAGNRLSFVIQVLPDRIIDKNEVFNIVAEEFNLDVSEVEAVYKKRFKAPFSPLTLVDNVAIRKALLFKEKYRDISGLLVSEDIKRYYFYDSVASHVLGYLGEISDEELIELKPYGYRYSSLIGKSGIEKTLEPYLKGTDGGMLVKVDNRGRIIEVLSRENPERGLDVYLTLDLNLQKKAEELMSGKQGCFLAMDVKTAEVIVFVSNPGFNPNVFLNSQDHDVEALLNSKTQPFFNRAIQAEYPLGSIFKLLVATAGLEEGSIAPGAKFFCPGFFDFKGRKYKCWKEEGHGWQNLRDAVVHSCNVYFYQAGLKVGVKDIVSYSKKFGFGEKTGIDLPYESSGFLPSPDWKLKQTKEIWYPGDTINLSIGQGYLLVTPVQVLRFIAAIANGGYMVTPVVCKSISGEKTYRKEAEKLSINSKTLNLVRDGMRGVVNDPTGTGQLARVGGFVSGKTATAQTPLGNSHAWFTGFAPYKNTEIVFLVFVEHGGGGGFVAARMAREFLQYYFDKDSEK